MLDERDKTFRDQIIIRNQVDEDSRLGEPHDPVLQSLSQAPAKVSEADYEIAAPMILLEGDRKALNIADFYFAPSASVPSVPRDLFLPKWAGFCRLLSSGKVVGDITQRCYAYVLLRRAVLSCRDKFGASEARRLVRDLHRHRWTVGAEMTANLLTTSICSSDESFYRVANSAPMIDEMLGILRTELDEAKDVSNSLTDWCERLYLINPLAWELLGYLRHSRLKDAQKWYRFVAEVDADIAPVIMLCEGTARYSIAPREFYLTWVRGHFEVTRAEAKSFAEFSEKMDYLLVSRTTIPKFWHDLAIKSYESPADDLPSGLNAVEPYQGCSIAILQVWSMRWRDEEASTASQRGQDGGG